MHAGISVVFRTNVTCSRLVLGRMSLARSATSLSNHASSRPIMLAGFTYRHRLTVRVKSKPFLTQHPLRLALLQKCRARQWHARLLGSSSYFHFFAQTSWCTWEKASMGSLKCDLVSARCEWVVVTWCDIIRRIQPPVNSATSCFPVHVSVSLLLPATRLIRSIEH